MTDFSLIPVSYSGKVRSVRDIGYNLLAITTSNRLSAFDRYIIDIPDKGVLLNGMASFWFNKTASICPNHFLYSEDNVMIVKKCIPFKIEVIVRGYITGNTDTSLWTHYARGEHVYCGISFPNGLVKNQKLETPVITPTTKETDAHDQLITPEEIVKTGLTTQEQWDIIQTKALQLFDVGQKIALEKGYILVDTKYEFGIDISEHISGHISSESSITNSLGILVIDELHTCDSSRYWRASSYQERFNRGEEPESIDKDAVRKFLSTLPEFEQIKAGEKGGKLSSYEIAKFIPQTIIDKTRNAYLEIFEAFKSDFPIHPLNTSYPKRTFNEIVNYYLQFGYPKVVVIIMGSKSDTEFSQKIQEYLKNRGIYSQMFIASAHKSPQKVLDILDGYECSTRKVVYITVAGRSNALSGFVGANSRFPCIACPPFKDQLDMSINIHSSLQMPSEVPVMTVLDPQNACLSAIRILDLC